MFDLSVFDIWAVDLFGLYSVVASMLLVVASILDIRWQNIVEFDPFDWLEAALEILMSLAVLGFVMLAKDGHIIPNMGVSLVSMFIFFKKTSVKGHGDGRFGGFFWSVFFIFFIPVIIYSSVATILK